MCPRKHVDRLPFSDILEFVSYKQKNLMVEVPDHCEGQKTTDPASDRSPEHQEDQRVTDECYYSLASEPLPVNLDKSDTESAKQESLSDKENQGSVNLGSSSNQGKEECDKPLQVNRMGSPVVGSATQQLQQQQQQGDQTSPTTTHTGSEHSRDVEPEGKYAQQRRHDHSDATYHYASVHLQANHAEKRVIDTTTAQTLFSIQSITRHGRIIALLHVITACFRKMDCSLAESEPKVQIQLLFACRTITRDSFRREYRPHESLGESDSSLPALDQRHPVPAGALRRLRALRAVPERSKSGALHELLVGK